MGLRSAIRATMFGLACVIALPASGAAPAPRPAAMPATPAATPPMGWNPYNAFGLDYGEADVMAQADLLLSLGLADLGYRYVNVDDGWWLRREGGTIAVRTGIYPSARLPDGTTSLRPFVDRLHAMGLKAGIYTDIGRNNCAQRWVPGTANLPEGTIRQREVGTYGHHDADAALLFARWGFDFIKIDACGVADYGPDQEPVRRGTYRAFPPLIVRERPDRSDAAELARQYGSFADAVRRAVPDRAPLVSICAWGQADVNDWAHRHGQMWRTSFDIAANWKSMLLNFDSTASRALFAGPGRWNDPDMLEVGNGEFDGDHPVAARAHMSLWAIMAAPLILGNDLRRAAPAILDIVRNRAVIAVNQDPAGNQGVVVSLDGDAQVVVKAQSTPGRKAVALVNRGDRPLDLSVALADLGLSPAAPTMARDLWSGNARRVADGRIAARLAPRETALFLLDGQPLEAGVSLPADMPARFAVADRGYKAPDRTPTRQWVLARIGFHPFGAPLMRDGRHDHAGLGVAGGSRVAVRLDGAFAQVTLDPRMLDSRSGRYAVLGDGRVLRQGIATRAAQPLSLDVRGVRQLELRAPEPADGTTAFAWHAVRFRR